LGQSRRRCGRGEPSPGADVALCAGAGAAAVLAEDQAVQNGNGRRAAPSTRVGLFRECPSAQARPGHAAPTQSRPMRGCAPPACCAPECTTRMLAPTSTRHTRWDTCTRAKTRARARSRVGIVRDSHQNCVAGLIVQFDLYFDMHADKVRQPPKKKGLARAPSQSGALAPSHTHTHAARTHMHVCRTRTRTHTRTHARAARTHLHMHTPARDHTHYTLLRTHAQPRIHSRTPLATRSRTHVQCVLTCARMCMRMSVRAQLWAR
jgi:hypothetical protein